MGSPASPGTMRWLVPFLLSSLALAGCVDDEPAPEPVEGPETITDPTDYSYVDRDTDGSGFHIHDYWRGQDVLTVLDSSQETGRTSCSSCDWPDVFRFRPDEGQTIPQGARNVTVTIDWTDNGESDHDGIELWIKTAAESEPTYYADVTQSEPILFESTNEDNDPPHHQLSLWEFWFVMKTKSDDSASFGGTASMVVTIERGLEVPAWPPHPDPWQGGTELDVLDETRQITAHSSVQTPVSGTNNCSAGDCMGFHSLSDGETIPWDSDHLRVRLEYDQPSTPTLSLWYHAADTWELQRLEADESGPDGMTFTIPVVPSMGDSPYAQQSLWEFYTHWSTPEGVQHFTGTYTLSATAVKAV